MIKELYKKTTRETSLNVTQSKIDSVRKKSITRSGCRVYNNGYIGVSGTLGEPTDVSWQEAEANLSAQIPYPYDPEKNKKRVRDLREINIDDKEFISVMEDILDILHKEYPGFIFSNKINMIETEISLSNDLNLDYISYDKTIGIDLLAKDVESVNIFDTGVICQSRRLEKENILKIAREMLQDYKNKMILPKNEKAIVAISESQVLGKIIEELNGEAIGRGTSLLCNKINSKVFSKDFSVFKDNTEGKYHTPFFDMEGVVNENDKCALIGKGVVIKGYTDKKNAEAFSVPLTGAAGGAYDEVPTLGISNFSIEPSNKTLKEMLNGELAIVIIMASGGDFTSKGDYASPVQMAMLTDGEHLIGRLPEFGISGNIFDLFGDDFIGLTKDKPFMGEHVLVTKMRVK